MSQDKTKKEEVKDEEHRKRGRPAKNPEKQIVVKEEVLEGEIMHSVMECNVKHNGVLYKKGENFHSDAMVTELFKSKGFIK